MSVTKNSGIEELMHIFNEMRKKNTDQLHTVKVAVNVLKKRRAVLEGGPVTTELIKCHQAIAAGEKLIRSFNGSK